MSLYILLDHHYTPLWCNVCIMRLTTELHVSTLQGHHQAYKIYHQFFAGQRDCCVLFIHKILVFLFLQLWQHQSHFTSPSPVVCIATSKLSITTAMPPPCYVMAALADGSIHCLYRDSLKQVRSKTLWVTWNFISSTSFVHYTAFASVYFLMLVSC